MYKNKMKIIILSPPYSSDSGGITVLHKLCDILISIGYNAGFYVENDSFNVNFKYKSNKFYIHQIDKENDIVIYPEIYLGNPLGIKNVVRYILHTGHIYENRIQTWGENDNWLYYSERFYDGIKPKNILNITDSKLDYFIDYKNERLYKECFTFRKQHNNKHLLNIIHSKDAIEIPFNCSDDFLLNIFNRCERFYCYDQESHLSVIASLCGCDSIIVPFDLPKEKIINTQPSLKYGVSFGLDGLNKSRYTRDKLRDYLLNQEKEQYVK